MPKCPMCNKGNPKKLVGNLKLKGNDLVCELCGAVYIKNYKEEDGAVIADKNIAFELEPNDVLFLAIIKEKGENEKLVSERVLESPFKDSKKVKKYRVIADYKVYAYYE